MKRGNFPVLLGLVLLLFAACERKEEKNPASTAALPVVLVKAREIVWPKVVSVPATVSAVDTALLASRTGGWVTSVEVDAGAHVAKSALLAEVGAADARGRLAEAQSRLEAAQAALKEAEDNERRSRTLLQEHVTAPQQYEAVRRRYLTAKSEADAASATLDVAKSNINYADIRAPFAGVVAEKNVRPGDFAAPGATLFLLASNEPQIRAYVGPETFSGIKLGEKAQVVIHGEKTSATVTLASAAADPKTRAHLVELRPRGETAAPYGAYAELRLTIGQSQLLAVPESALVRRAGLLGVFVVDASQRVHFRLVHAGETRERIRRRQSGSRPGRERRSRADRGSHQRRSRDAASVRRRSLKRGSRA